LLNYKVTRTRIASRFPSRPSNYVSALHVQTRVIMSPVRKMVHVNRKQAGSGEGMGAVERTGWEGKTRAKRLIVRKSHLALIGGPAAGTSTRRTPN